MSPDRDLPSSERLEEKTFNLMSSIFLGFEPLVMGPL